MKRVAWKKWEKPGDKHLMNRIQWDAKEVDYMQKVLDEDWFGYGIPNKCLEEKLSDFTGIKFFNLTNSGSTALTTALKVLFNEGRLERRDKILHPVTTFPTSISCAIDYGLTPVFIETKPDTYVVDEEQVEKAIKKYPSIKGMILPHLLGNIPNMDKIKESLGSRILIEDCCDTMGGKFNGKHVGSFGDFMAMSFYGSHHISSAGVGGAIGTNKEKYGKLAKSIIFWGHDYDTHNSSNNDKDHKDFLARYDCQTIGSDFQLSAIQAAFALAQFEKLRDFIRRREEQFNEMNNLFEKCPHFNLPKSDPDAKPSWFCYPLTIKKSAPFKRKELVRYLTENKVEIRPIMNGNILKQKPYQGINRLTLNGNDFPIGNYIQESGLFIPCWGMPENQKEDYYKILRNFIEHA